MHAGIEQRFDRAGIRVCRFRSIRFGEIARRASQGTIEQVVRTFLSNRRDVFEMEAITAGRLRSVAILAAVARSRLDRRAESLSGSWARPGQSRTPSAPKLGSVRSRQPPSIVECQLFHRSHQRLEFFPFRVRQFSCAVPRHENIQAALIGGRQTPNVGLRCGKVRGHQFLRHGYPSPN